MLIRYEYDTERLLSRNKSFFFILFICIFRHAQESRGTIISIDVYRLISTVDDAVHATSDVRATG